MIVVAIIIIILPPPSLSSATLKLGNFHRTFLSDFTDIVSSYIDTLERQLRGDLTQSFTIETWLPVG